MKRLRYIALAYAGMMLAAVACTNEFESGAEEFDRSEFVPAEIVVSLPDSFGPKTRRTVDGNTDSWTTKSFTTGDRIGMFATNGMVDERGNTLWIKNAYMDYDKPMGAANAKFRNDELIINMGLLTRTGVGRYVYFPYDEEMPLPNADLYDTPSYPTSRHRYYRGGAKQRIPPLIYTGETVPYETAYATASAAYMDDTDVRPGMYLRERVVGDYVNPDKVTYRCKDYMYLSNFNLTGGNLGGGFYHGFTELIIVRGNGFDQVPAELKDDITIVLNRGVTRMRLNAQLNNNTGQFTWMPELYYWEGDTGKPTDVENENKEMKITRESARRWKAWRGKDYIDTDKETGLAKAREAWYAILPTAHSYSHTIASEIEIYDDKGRMCSVSSFELYVDPNTGIADKAMHPSNCYALEIVMTELGAIARPHKISEWVEFDEDLEDGEKDSHDITDERTAGIGKGEMDKFIGTYQEYLTQYPTFEQRPANIDDTYSTNLSKYGNYNTDTKVWTFFVTDDVEATGTTYIRTLYDVIEGVSQVENYKITNLSRTFIGEIREKGALKRLDFEDLYVKPNLFYPPDGDANKTAGAVVNRLNGGTMENCNINDGTMIGTADVQIGMLCGTVEQGSTVENCTVTGALIGSTAAEAEYRGVFGKVNGTVTMQNVNKSGLIVRGL